MREEIMVFINNDIDEAEEQQCNYQYVTLEKAKELGKEPIKCLKCDKNAVVLDCFYPYHTDYNACQEHKV